MVRYIKNIILPYVEKVKLEKRLSPDQPSLVLFDVFKGHQTEEVDTLLEENKLLKVLVPSTATGPHLQQSSKRPPESQL